MDDLISRQAAIDALEAKKDKSAKGDIGCFYNTIIQNNIDALKGLPSAQPEINTDGDTISRQDAICAVSDACFELRGVFGRCEDALKALPSAQPERKTGRWIYGEDDVAMCDGYHCSECGFFVPWDYKRKSIDFIKDYNFCPNCESPMVKEGEA